MNIKWQKMKKINKNQKINLFIQWLKFFLANTVFIVLMIAMACVLSIVAGFDKSMMMKFMIVITLLAYFTLSDVLFYLPLKHLSAISDYINSTTSKSELPKVNEGLDSTLILATLKSQLRDLNQLAINHEVIFGDRSPKILAEKATLLSKIAKLEWFG